MADRARPPVWAGVECSVVRVGDRVVDELALTRHLRRDADVRRLADLGVTAVRYPALWEKHGDAMRGRLQWAWLDRRVPALLGAGLRPILGLLHHGTGRRGEVLDPAWPAAFGAYAGEVAARYPGVDAFLPVNEPLTNARFAGLYGHWYPHATDDRAFTAILLAQVEGFRAAARAIRAVRPGATVILCDDAGRTFSTPELADQARFDDERAWLGFDLALGRVGRDHWLRGWLERAGGADPRRLDALAADPEPPDLLGINHYLTSDRFLDHRLERYPASTHGGNGRVAYSDVEAVRVLAEDRDDWGEALAGAVARYGLPIALTEVHAGGTMLDRRAWWWEAVHAAEAAAARGADVRGVTAWQAFGSWEWASLLTRVEGHYEPGVFDMRTVPPSPTPMAGEVALAAAGAEPPPLAPPWWRRPTRLLYPPLDREGRDVGGPEAATIEPPAA